MARKIIQTFSIAVGILTVTSLLPADAQAQRLNGRGSATQTPMPGGGGSSGGGGGYRGPGWGGIAAGVIMVAPLLMQRNNNYDDDDFDGRPPRRPSQQQAAQPRRPSNVPPANERRYVPDEVVIELRNNMPPAQVDALQRRHRLTRLESQPQQLTGTTIYRWRVPDRRAVPQVVRELERDAVVASAQPNYKFTLQQEAKAATGDPAQYEIAKLNLLQAHALTTGDDVLIAVIDSGVDDTHPDLTNSVSSNFNALGSPMAPHNHGTAIAGLIAGHGKLLGAAPKAKILAIRAFDPKDAGADGTTFAILKGIDWAVTNKARIINMSFAGPNDPAMRRNLDAASKKGVILIAAAGNAGPKSPPLYPAAFDNVIAVSGTDVDDKVFAQSNRGKHIAIAAPGDQLLVAMPGGYEVSSGTSYSAAAISGVAALMIQRDPLLTPAQARRTLQSTAKDLGPKGPDADFGAGLANALAAVSGEAPAVASGGKTSDNKAPVERVSTGNR